MLGQSFGGFCVTTYLSLAPDGLREAFITGGLPPIGLHTDEVYRRTYPRVLERNSRYYDRYPDDRVRVRELHRLIAEEGLTLPSGDRLSSRRFQQLGFLLGMSDGAERLHYLLERPPDSPAFLHDVETALPFARNPIFCVLHESCYADGCSTRWSAERLRPREFDALELFTGEHIFSWMLDDYGALRPLREAAHLPRGARMAAPLRSRRSSRETMSPSRPRSTPTTCTSIVLSRNETAALIRGLRVWLTSEYEHDGLGVDGERVLDRLIDLARGRL